MKSVKVVGLGFSKNINIPDGSKLSYIPTIFDIDLANLFIKGKNVDEAYELENGDVIIFGCLIKGAVGVRRNGKSWEIHKCDSDFRPSDFHAHNEEYKMTVDLYTGITYKKNTTQRIGKLNKKEYKEILQYLSKSKEENLSSKAKKVLSQHHIARTIRLTNNNQQPTA